ncbi:hypothetical protein HF526_24085 [Pseudonocardia sp. K10HN5]|uniref:Glyoxalase-like domain-containing protein n=1 Tax=Pseudonocardia acidicola TaxID=2724939 RepID=A0ABX1SIR4_9PSEU|nr:VOC family protein [Pseudonocardia acidicola]NMI00369.1 hypothetical protein [Pseudonocardia acidicola]
MVPVPASEGKQVEYRLRLDLAPCADDDQSVEVARLEQLGAERVDVGHGDETFMVLADPEGNEFCVLSPRDR